MAACKSLRHIFDSTTPENKSTSLLDSLSPLNHIRTFKPPLDHHSFTEIFGELHFRENHHHNPTSAAASSSFSFLQPPTVSGSTPIDSVSQSANNDKVQNEKSGDANTLFSTNDGYARPYHRRSESLNSDSLQLCTEGLGSESLGDVEDLKIEEQNSGDKMADKGVHVRRQSSDNSYFRKKRSNGKAMFPPPISYIGQAGKPSVSFQSYRQNGRFVLKEVRIPTQECLRASREDGRLRLSIVQPNNDDDDDDDDDEDENDGDDDAEEDGDDAEDDADVEVGGDEVKLEEGVVKEVDEGKMKKDFERGCS